MKENDGGIRTVTGRKVWLTGAPTADTLDPFDCAHALAMLCRFVGHTREFYSVAQHCVLLSLIVPPEIALWGLLHDAPEAWLGDVSRPLKHSGGMVGYKAAERRMMGAVCLRFNLPPDEPSEVARADDLMLATEQRDLFPCYGDLPNVKLTPSPLPRIIPWSHVEARSAFLWRLRGLGVQVAEPSWAVKQRELPESLGDWQDG